MASLALDMTADGCHTVFAQVLGLQDLHHPLSDALAQLHLQLPVHLLLLAEILLRAVAQIEWMQKVDVPVGSPQALVAVAAANTAPACITQCL